MPRPDIHALTSARAQAVFGAVSLVALLLYTWTHTGALLARYVEPDKVGYICAFGVELAVVSLSLRIGDLRRSGQTAGLFVGVLVAVLVVSALANIAEGYAAMYDGQLLTLDRIHTLDRLQALFGLSATGLISVIVFALSDIIGSDVRRAAERPMQPAQPVTPPVHLDSAPPARTEQPARPPRAARAPAEQATAPAQSIPVQPVKLTTAARRAEVARLYGEWGPDWSLRRAAAQFHVAPATIGADLKALKLNGYHHAH